MNDSSLLTIQSHNPTCITLNEHLWQTRRDPTTLPSVWAIFAFFYSLIIICGITGNLCVILAISRTKSLQTVPNLFIFSLSCSDIVVCLTSATITPITALRKSWIFGKHLCSFAPLIAGSSLSFSTFTLAAISVDRFLLIRFPMKKPFSHYQAILLVLCIIVLAVGLAIPAALMHSLKGIDPFCGEYCFESWAEYNSQRRAYGTIVLTVQFIIPLLIITVCYTAISVRLGRSMLLKKGKKLAMTDQQIKANKRRQRTNRMFIAMVIAFLLSWVWSVLFNVFNDYNMLPKFIKDQEYLFGITTHCLSMSSTVWNPILYSFFNFQLRAAFIQLMPECIKGYFINEDDESFNRRMNKRNAPSTLLLTADSRAFDRSGTSTPIPQTTKNGWLTPSMTGPRNSFAFTPPDTNSVTDWQLVSSNQHSQKYGTFDRIESRKRKGLEADFEKFKLNQLKSVDLLLVKNAQSEHLSNASSIAQYPTPLNSPTTNSQPERSQVFGRPEYDNTSHGIEWRSPADTSKQKRACSAVYSSHRHESAERRLSYFN